MSFPIRSETQRINDGLPATSASGVNLITGGTANAGGSGKISVPPRAPSPDSESADPTVSKPKGI